MTIAVPAGVAWTARDAVLAQLQRYRALAKADARYAVTVARMELALSQLDAAIEQAAER